MIEGFKYILNNTNEGELTLQNAPEGWKEIEFVITRSSEKWGLFSEFSGSLGFLKDGKVYIDNIIETYGINEIVELTIQYRDPVTLIYETYISAILDLSTYKKEEYITQVSFEDSGFKRKLRSRSDLSLQYNASESIEGESLSLATPYENITLRYIDSGDVEQFSTVETIFPWNAFKSIIQQITDSGYEVLDSSILGRATDGYSNDGDLSFRTIQNGKLIRGYTESTDNLRINFSLDELFNAFDKQIPIGLGFSTDSSDRDIVVIEERNNFFESDIVLTLDDNKLNNLSFQPANDLIYKAIKIGYENFATDNEKGLTEYNAKSEYVTPVTVSDNDLDLINRFRADGTAINQILNNFKKADTDPEGSEFDAQLFLIDAYNDSGTIRNSVNQNYSTVSGIYDNSTLYYNLDLSPQRILETKYAEWLNIGLQKLTGQKIKHTFAETLDNLTTLRVGDTDTIVENSDIDIDDLPEARLSGREINLNYGFSPSEIAALRGNERKIIKFNNYIEGGYSYGWIKEVSTKPIDGNVTNVALYEVGNIELLTGFLLLQTGYYLLLQTGGKIKLHG